MACLWLGLLGCAPSFDAATCFGPGECPGGYVCQARACVPVDAQVEPDGDVTDAGVDDGPPGLLLQGAVQSELGRAIAAVGDLDGDGRAELVVTAPGASGVECPAFCGQVTVLSDRDGVVQPQAVIDGPPIFHGNFGQSAGAAGDLNGDGFADVVIARREGDAAIIYGSQDGAASGRADRVGVRIAAADPTAPFARQIQAWDLDRDGYDELLVNAWHYGAVRCPSPGLGSGVDGQLLIYPGGPDGVGAPTVVRWPANADPCDCQPNGRDRRCGQIEQFTVGPPMGADLEPSLILAAPYAHGARGRWLTRWWSRPEAMDGPTAEGVCPGEVLGAAGGRGWLGLLRLGAPAPGAPILATARAVAGCPDSVPSPGFVRFTPRGDALGSGTPVVGLLPETVVDALGMRPILEGPSRRLRGVLFAGRIGDDRRIAIWASRWDGATLGPGREVFRDDADHPLVGPVEIWWPQAGGNAWLVVPQAQPDGTIHVVRRPYAP